MIFNKFEFKKAFERKIDSIQSFVESQDKDVKEVLRLREKEKRQKVGRNRDSIQEVKNYIENKGL